MKLVIVGFNGDLEFYNKTNLRMCHFKGSVKSYGIWEFQYFLTWTYGNQGARAEDRKYIELELIWYIE